MWCVYFARNYPFPLVAVTQDPRAALARYSWFRLTSIDTWIKYFVSRIKTKPKNLNYLRASQCDEARKLYDIVREWVRFTRQFHSVKFELSNTCIHIHLCSSVIVMIEDCLMSSQLNYCVYLKRSFKTSQ